MGTVCHVAVQGGSDSLVLATEEEVRRLEALWSRFRADSEISRLNSAGGERVEVGPETIELLQRAAEAWRRFEGWFDPFMARELAAAGYDRDINLLAGQSDAVPFATSFLAASDARVPPQDPIEIDSHEGWARLEPGIALDPGGIGKGLAADRVSGLLLAAGASGALVNLGGDLRARGAAPERGWRIAIDDPFDRSRPPVAVVGVTDSGLCTSTALKRRWRTRDGETAHHILDPRTGRPAPIEIAAITVTATAGWLAEALATAVMLAGPEQGAAMLAAEQATALVVHLDGRLQRL